MYFHDVIILYKLYISIQVIFYINDILVVGINMAACREKVVYVAKVLGNLGFLLNLAKSSTEPSQVVTYLGFIWDLRSWMVSLKWSREVKTHKLAAKLRKFSIVTCRQVSSLLGMIQSTDTVVPLARARMRRTQWEFLASCKSEEGYNTFMYLSEEALKVFILQYL